MYNTKVNVNIWDKTHLDALFYVFKLIIIENKKELIYLFFYFILYTIFEFLLYSKIISNIINSLRNGNKPISLKVIKFFTIIVIAYIIISYFYREKYWYIYNLLKQRIRAKLIDILLTACDHKYININYTQVITPVNRFMEVILMILSSIIRDALPYFTFIIILFVYLSLNDYRIAITFIGLTLLNWVIVFKNIGNIFNKNLKYEASQVDLETKLIELMNNMEKILFRGFSKLEIGKFNIASNKVIDNGYNMYSILEKVISSTITINTLNIYIIIILSLYLKDSRGKRLDSNIVVSIITILLVFRSKCNHFCTCLSTLIDSAGRAGSVIRFFKEPISIYRNIQNLKFSDINSEFNRIEIKNLYYTYDGKHFPLKNFNIKLHFDKNNGSPKIIGLYGPSGYGKSTLAKILIKIYRYTKGNITINGRDLKTFSPKLLKENIIYINQTDNLFDTSVTNNIMYGCDQDICRLNLSKIINNRHIKRLFANKQLQNIRAGLLGNRLSGGQRRLINVINGLITPCKLLILDEPTTGLDINIKKELVNLIKLFKNNKNGILIITHDYAIKTLFDEIIYIDKIKN